MSLTPKQERFVEEYLVDLNATQAAIRAGYSERTAHSQGPRLLENVEIAAAIQARRDKVSEKAELTAEWVLERLKVEAEREDESATHAARVSALEKLGKYFALFNDRVEHEHKGGITVRVVREA